MAKKTGHREFDEAQFEALFKQHFRPLCHFAEQFTRDLDTAQDITQKVFLMLWERRQHIDPEQSVQSYLYTAVRSRCLNYIRDHKKYRSRILDLEVLEDCQEEDRFEPDLEALQRQIEQAMDSLPDKCRQVFEMSRFQHLKYQEISETLGISVKTVEAHMSKALKELRMRLKDALLSLWWLINWWLS